MKIAVVTNYDQRNYGSVLQAFALQSKLNELGAENYILKVKKKEARKSPIKKIRGFLSTSDNQYSIKAKLEIRKARKQFTERYKKMDSFCNSKIICRYCDSLESAHLMVGDRNALIVGSDQVWSTAGQQLSEFTTLQFGPSYLHRFSYAASVGTTELTEKAQYILRGGLKNFDGISVRESSSIDLIKTVTNSPVSWNVDPTFLYNREFWKRMEHIPKKSSRYIFLYIIRPEPIAFQAAVALSNRTGLPIKVISNRILKANNLENIKSAGIEDFLGLISHADYVVTNSFHGTAFSVQYHKPFVSVAVSGSGMRVRDFLKEINLERRIISSPDNIEIINESINWNEVDRNIQIAREKSITYLKSIVNSNTAIKFNKEKIQLFRDKTECSACAACQNACPVDAIQMQTDLDGCMYPEVNDKRCIHCGKCKKVCNYQVGNCRNEVISAWGAVSNEEEIRMKSSSGGIFASLAGAVLEKGGVVYGCALQAGRNGLIPTHIAVRSKENLSKLQTSKYAQSSIGYVYREIKHDLLNGKYVLFSGTPCQVDGLKGFLENRQYDNLFTVDLVCHGVPGAPLLQDYLKMIEVKKGVKVKNINFRDKRFGWGERGTIFCLDNNGQDKEQYFDNYNSSFYNLYLISAFYRSNCYSCRYTGEHRPGDITIGDFWGVEKIHSEWLQKGGWNKEQGISCVIVNSRQGQKLMKIFGQYIEIKPTKFENIVAQNKPIIRPAVPKQMREKVLNLYRNGGYEAVDKWFWKVNGKRLFIYGTWDKIPEKYRKQWKKLKNTLKR